MIPKIKKISLQTLRCLIFLANSNVIHCDLKPENILLMNQESSSVKVIDFGSSCFDTKKTFTYIQSRFYRAPEIVLGMPYSFAIDMWSFGCILVELYTGLPIFPAESEKELIACIAEVFGEPSVDYLNTGSRSCLYFTNDWKLKPFKNTRGKKRTPGTRDLNCILKGADEEFISLVTQCLRWDYRQRISAEAALKSA